MHLVSARNSLEYCASVALPTFDQRHDVLPRLRHPAHALRCQHIRKAMRGLEMEHAHPTPGVQLLRAGQAPEGSAAKAPHPVLLGVEYTHYPATAQMAPRCSPVACRALHLLAHAGRVRQLGAHGLQPRQQIAARLSRRAIGTVAPVILRLFTSSAGSRDVRQTSRNAWPVRPQPGSAECGACLVDIAHHRLARLRVLHVRARSRVRA